MIQNLLIEIARCPEVRRAQFDKNHRCFRVVNTQTDGPANHSFHLPEPWSGHIEKAPILFVGSNPSIDYGENFPTAGWSDNDVIDFFANRFGDGNKDWAKENKSLDKDGRRLKANQTWSEIQSLSKSILGREVIPGIDYAITEIVRCKSKDAVGVREATVECMKRHFALTLAAAKAKIVIALGKPVQAAICEMLNVNSLRSSLVIRQIASIDRIFVGLGKPGSSQPRKLPGALPRGQEDLDLIRTFL